MCFIISFLASWVVLACTFDYASFESVIELFDCRTIYDRVPYGDFLGGTGECAYMANWCECGYLRSYDNLVYA